MTDLEKYVCEQISTLVSNYERIDIRANISDSSYSLEFFITDKGRKMQCFDMVDNGIIKEDDLDAVFENIAKYVRNTVNYQKGVINKVEMSILK